MELPRERDRAIRREPDVRRTQEKFVDDHKARTDVILHLRLFEVELRQLIDLQDLAERNKETVLLHLSIPQIDFTRAAQRVWVRGFACSIKKSFQPPL